MKENVGHSLILKLREMVTLLLNPSCNEDADLTKYNKLKKEIDLLLQEYEKHYCEELQEYCEEVQETQKVVPTKKWKRVITPVRIRKYYEEDTNNYPIELDYKGKILCVDFDYVEWLECKLIDQLIN